VLRQLAVIFHEASWFAHAPCFSCDTKIFDRTPAPFGSAIRYSHMQTWVRSPLPLPLLIKRKGRRGVRASPIDARCSIAADASRVVFVCFKGKHERFVANQSLGLCFL